MYYPTLHIDTNTSKGTTKKVLFVDIHGVKCFPYHGRRTHFPASNTIVVAAQTDKVIYLE